LITTDEEFLGMPQVCSKYFILNRNKKVQEVQLARVEKPENP